MRQEKIERASPPPKRRPDPLARAEAERQVAAIEEEPLREALARLGARVLAAPSDATRAQQGK